MALLCKVNSTDISRASKVKLGLQVCSMQPLGPADEQLCLRPPHLLEQYVKKKRVPSLNGNLSPVPSYYSEPAPVSLWHHKCITGVLPKFRGYDFWQEDTKSMSRTKRSRGFSKILNTDLTLPPLSANNDAVRAGLMVQGSSCLHVSTFPPINTRAQVLERPPSRARRRDLDHLTRQESMVEGKGKQGKRRPQPSVKNPTACFTDNTDSKVKFKDNLRDCASERCGTLKINLGITLPKHLERPAGLRPLNLVDWMES